MKTVNNTPLTAKEIRKERLHKLIKACLEKYSESEMIEAFNDITGTDYVDSEDIEEPEEMEEWEMTNKLKARGYCIFKPNWSYQAEQLKEYAATNIFPYYNEQQAAILF
jgi:hypothetical protein